MKLTGNIIEVATTGDGIRITAQAKIGRGEYQTIEKQLLIVADTQQNRRSFYLGRDVTITIKPRGRE